MTLEEKPEQFLDFLDDMRFKFRCLGFISFEFVFAAIIGGITIVSYIG